MDQTSLDKLKHELGFEEAGVINYKPEKGLYLGYGNVGGQVVLLRVFSSNDHERADEATRELEVDKIIASYNDLSSTEKIKKAKVLSTGTNEMYAWQTREYFAGNSYSEYDSTQKLGGYDVIRKEYIDSDKIINEIINNLIALRGISLSEYGLLKVYPKRFSEDFSQEEIRQISQAVDIDLSAQIEFYHQNKEDYFSSNNLTLSSGEFTPSNIVVGTKEEIVLTDFEFFTFDNFSLDATFFWMFLWRYPEKQKLLFSKLFVNEKDLLFFRMSLIRLLLYHFRKIINKPYKDEKTKFESVEFFKNHIWKTYLEKALLEPIS